MLRRELGLFSASAVLVGSAIGSGIFRSPSGIAAKIPHEGLYVLDWAIGGLIALCGALTCAELSNALPDTGGFFVYLREGWGRLPAFLFGWSELVVIRASAIGAVSTVFSEYLLRLAGIDKPDTVRYVAAATILLLGGCNVAGVKLAALVQNITASTKIIALLLLVIVAFAIGAQHPPATAAQSVALGGVVSLTSFGMALVSIMWVYDGWGDLTFVSGEVKRPERTLPIALIIGTLAIIGIYLLVNLAYLHLLEIKQVADSKLVAADTAYRVVGGGGVRLVSIAVMLAAFGTLNGSMMTGPRIFFAMADDGLFFKGIAAVHPRFKTPYVAISLAAVLAIVFVMVRSFEQLADTFVLAIWPFYAGRIAAAYLLRRKRPNMPRPYKTLGYPLTPAIFVLAALFPLGNAFLYGLSYFRARFAGAAGGRESSGALLVLGIILAGIPVFYLWKAVHK